MKSAFFGAAAVAALALTSGTASAHPPGYYGGYYGGPVIVRPAPVVIAPQPAFGFGGSGFSFGVTRPGVSFGFSTFDNRSYFAPPVYRFGPSFGPSFGYPGYRYGYYGYGRRW